MNSNPMAAAPDTLHGALAEARNDPRVVAIARSLRLDLANDSLWQRVLVQAEQNYRREEGGDSIAVGGLEQAGSVETNRRLHSRSAIAAYAMVEGIC